MSPCPCAVQLSAKCIYYGGINLTNINVITNENLESILQKINNLLAFHLTTIGSSGPSTWNNTTRTLNVPVYTGGSGSDTNFAITDLTATGNRSHDFASHSLAIQSLSSLDFSSATGSTGSSLHGSVDGYTLRAYGPSFTSQESVSSVGVVQAAGGSGVLSKTKLDTSSYGIYTPQIVIGEMTTPQSTTEGTYTDKAIITHASLTGLRTYQLPDNSGVLALSVNGFMADNTGNITVPLGGLDGEGTVTSVNATATNALTFSGGPITDSGTLALSWTGDVTQYVAGDGTLHLMPAQLRAGTYLISGGLVTWLHDLVFEVSPAVYVINGGLYTSDGGEITLDPSDITDPRIDTIGLDTDGNVIKVTGIAATNPEAPQVDPSTQIYLTQILLPAGATVPAGVTTMVIYDENLEWATSTNGTITANFADTTLFYTGSKSIKVDSWTQGSSLVFTHSGTLDAGTFTTLSGWIYLETPLLNQQGFTLQLFNGSTAVSSILPISFSRTLTGGWQPFTMLVSSFLFGTRVFDTVRFGFIDTTVTTVHVDRLQFQSGILQSPGGFDTNFANTNLTILQPRTHQIDADASLNLFVSGNTSVLYMADESPDSRSRK
jgi:hypothetical protein